MKDNTFVLLAGEILLGLVILFVPDVTLKSVAVGAAAGLVGGHLNGNSTGGATA